ncbi:MAG: orotidine-5'-phosphate decarboxylase [Phycisphaerales bacterium]|nr:orotidine-5'-phosphate decarboxylase [Phycisphaerales bacterium]
MSSKKHPADLLCEAIIQKSNPLCAGIDPVIERIPECVQSDSPVQSIDAFCRGVIDVVKDIVPAVKFQSACFERYGYQGMKVLGELKNVASENGLQVVLDYKRGDIGLTAEHYAVAAQADGRADWVTVSPYLGLDSIDPFIDAGLGVFCLVRTSNPSGTAIQSQQLQNGQTVASSIASMLSSAGQSSIGEHGWSSIGAVVGATNPEDAIALRADMPSQIFLMPGVGAQGGTIESLAPSLRDGMGVLVPVSRSILYPERVTGDWQTDIQHAALAFTSSFQDGAPS